MWLNASKWGGCRPSTFLIMSVNVTKRHIYPNFQQWLQMNINTIILYEILNSQIITYWLRSVFVVLSGGPTVIGDAFPMHSRCTADASRRHRQYIADVFAMHRRYLSDAFAKFDWHVIVTYTWDHYIMVRLFNRPLYSSLSLYINCAFVTSRMHRENILKLRQDIGVTSGEHRRCFKDAFRISFHKNTSWVHRECIGTILMRALNFYWHLDDTI